eukprot:m.269293 g.269293  ORF g.269293 m.269293 type:complete len:214 (+) comp40534_c1_seq49:403-1044(+)
MRRMPDVYGFMEASSKSHLLDRLLYGRKNVHPEKKEPGKEQKTDDSASRPWQSCIGCSVVVSSFYFESYVGQLLGKTKLETGRIQLDGGVAVEYLRRKSLWGLLKLQALDVNSVAGAIGGCLSLRNLNGEVRLLKGEGCNPFLHVRLFLGEASVKLERLSTPFLMARLTDFCVKMHDKWSSIPMEGRVTIQTLRSVAHVLQSGRLVWSPRVRQ